MIGTATVEDFVSLERCFTPLEQHLLLGITTLKFAGNAIMTDGAWSHVDLRKLTNLDQVWLLDSLPGKSTFRDHLQFFRELRVFKVLAPVPIHDYEDKKLKQAGAIIK